METTPYIAKIVDYYETGNGNFFCREENKQEFDHHLDWDIFIAKDVATTIKGLPFWGIVVTDHNNQFFNGKTRLTCRVLSYDLNDLVKIFEEKDLLQHEIDKAIENYKVNLENYYIKSRKCKKALSDLKTNISVNTWLSINKNLFDEVTIRVEGLPVQPDGNFKGNIFKDINQFVGLYESLLNI